MEKPLEIQSNRVSYFNFLNEINLLNDFEKDNLRKAKRKLHRQTMQKKSGTFISSKDTKKIERAAGVRDQNLAEIDQVTAANKPKRNKPCPCGSGKKYKHCCS